MPSKNKDISKFLSETIRSGVTTAVTNNSVPSGLEVFATLDSLPISGLIAGQEAFVEENSRIYVSNGSGWYNTGSNVPISPTWFTEPDASYSVVDSATPLIITAKAQDSDTPNVLNQSFASDSAQYMVNITVDSSVFTFTPKSADSIGIEVAAGNLTDSNGDFIYTFKWSDGTDFVAKETTITYSLGGGGGAATPTGFYSSTRNWGGGYSTPVWPQMTSIHQAPDGKYYMTGYANYNNEGGWLLQFDEDGDFQWGKRWGNGYNQTRTLVFDGNNPIVIGDDDGYGNNFPSNGPYFGSLQKFDSSGNRTWSKIFRPTTVSSNYYGTGNFFYYGAVDAYGNFWNTSGYALQQTSPANYSEDVCSLMKYDASGTFQGYYLLPPSSTSPRCLAQALYIDKAGTSMYMGFTTYDPTATSYPHGNISKFDISSSGTLTYAWTKRYGQFYGSAHYDVPQKIYESSDGNIIVGGYTQQSNVNNDYHPTLMKLDASSGSWIWKKRYDNTYGSSQGGVSMITNDDKIFMYGAKYNNSTSHYEFFIREIDATDGSHVAIYELDFTGQANASVDNSGSYSWSQWRNSISILGMNINKDGNIILGLIPNGNGFDYRPSFVKLPSSMIAGTFGGGTGTYSGNLTISVKSVTPTDYTYAATDMTYASFSTINSVGGSYQMVNYNSGSYNNTLNSITVVDEQGVIS